MVNLRKEFEELLKEFGDWALLVKIDSKNRCKCVESLSMSPDPSCKRCLGSGYITKAEKINARSRQSSSQDVLPKTLSNRSVGEIAVGIREFYVDFNVRIKQKDLLVFCEWDGEVPLFNEYTLMYEVLNVDPLRADREGGVARLEYLRATTQSNPVNTEIKFDSIKKNIKGSQYYVAVKVY